METVAETSDSLGEDYDPHVQLRKERRLATIGAIVTWLGPILDPSRHFIHFTDLEPTVETLESVAIDVASLIETLAAMNAGVDGLWREDDDVREAADAAAEVVANYRELYLQKNGGELSAVPEAFRANMTAWLAGQEITRRYWRYFEYQHGIEHY